MAAFCLLQYMVPFFVCENIFSCVEHIEYRASFLEITVWCTGVMLKFVLFVTTVVVDSADFSDRIGRPRQTGYYVPQSEYELVCSYMLYVMFLLYRCVVLSSLHVFEHCKNRV